MKSLSDISLVARVSAFGDRRAFDALVRKYQEPVRRFFMAQTLGDAPLSDDLAQETFIRAYTHVASFRNVGGFALWLYRIAYRVLLDNVRSRKQTEGIDARAERIDGGASDKGLKIDIYSGLRLLMPEERLCVTLRLMEGQPVKRIAEISGMTENTVKSHLHRGKSKLATYLRENGYDG